MPPILRALGPRLTARRAIGQSMAEFALTVPMVLLMVLFGLDFGRVFLGWVSLNQATREAANFAAMNPTAWTVPYDLTAQAEYNRLVATETAQLNCDLATVPAPVFSSGTSIAAPATVTLTCDFPLITPIISVILGDSIPVTASSAFPIRAGTIEGVPVESATPTTTPGPTDSGAPTASPGPTSTPDPSASPGATPTAAPTPTPTPAPTATPSQCTVVTLLNLKTNKAAAAWKAAGFSGSVIFSPLVPPTYTIAWQSLTVGSTAVCTASITVRSSAP